MHYLRKKMEMSPTAARVIPFGIFLALTFCQGKFGPQSVYWFYLAKTIVGAWLIFLMRPLVAEMKWALSWEAILVGVFVFAIWVGLDGFYPSLNELLQKIGMGSSKTSTTTFWNPNQQFGENSGLALLFVATRILGSSIIVPPLEEVFYRSFLYRWIVRPDFQSVALNEFVPKAFFIVALMFGLSHVEWLPGILCALSYQWLVLRKNRLGDAMTAHAITNFLLGIWVVSRNAWKFW